MSPSVLLVTHVLSNGETHTAGFNEKITTFFPLFMNKYDFSEI